MKTVVQIEYVGDLAPYDLETEELAKAGARLLVTRGAAAADVLDLAREADVIWLEWTPRLTREVLEQLPRCSLILRWGVGYEQIDVGAATELGIAVGNAPTYCTLDVAEHALALLLSISRQVVYRHQQMRDGLWRAGDAAARRLAGATVGIVGIGRIGRQVARLCLATGARVVAYDPVGVEMPGVELMSFDELLAQADYLTIHVPLSDATRHLINADSLTRMKRGAVLVNTSRGATVNQRDLIAALESGHLAAAALDVFEQEPLPADDPIRAAPNIVLTPHEAAFSPQSMVDLRREIAQTTVDWITTGWAGPIVNPEVRDHLRVPAL